MTKFFATPHQLPATVAFLNVVLNKTMAAMTIQPGRLADTEDPSLSSLDSDSQSSFESRAYEKASNEEALLPLNHPNREEEDEHPSSGSRIRLLLWMLVNALATVGIVRTGAVYSIAKVTESLSNHILDLHQQIPLLFLPFQARPAQFRILPLLHDRHATLRPLPTTIRILRAQTGQISRNATIGGGNVFERDSAEFLPRLLLHPILPNLPRAPHAHGRCDRLLYVPEDTAPNGCLCPGSHLHRCGNGCVL